MRERSRLYAEWVARQSRRTSSDQLYSGDHLLDVAEYLNIPLRLQSPRTKYFPASSRPYAHLYSLDHGFTKPKQFSSAEEFESECDHNKQNPWHFAGMLFLTGYPTPEWLNAIGGELDINPLHLLEHLSFRPTIRLNTFTFPTLPSASTSIIKITMTTIGQIEHHRQSNSNEHLQHLRRQCASIVREAARLSEGNVSPGTEVLRRFYLHDINTFTIEQDTTISLVDKGNRWTILIMSDSNGDGKSPALPLREVDGFEKSDFYLTPVIQMNRHRHHHSHTDKGELISVKSHESAQNTLALLPANYGQMLDSQIAMHDPFYALYELLDFFASSEAQFVNMMHHHLSRQVDLAGRSTDTPSLADFQYTSELLETHLDRLKRLTSIVINRHTLEWPQCERQELRDAANENEAIAKLITDLQYLADALDHLLRRAERGKDILIGNTGTQVAKQSFWQNQKLGKLTTIGTWVAMAYVPWSFITAVFGMNVVEPFSIWTWAAASAIVLSILLVALAIWKRRWLCETISRIRRRFSM